MNTKIIIRPAESWRYNVWRVKFMAKNVCIVCNKEKGIITEEEFNSKKSQLLGI
jgi:hypothetical protein